MRLETAPTEWDQVNLILGGLKLANNQIVDISPLAGLVNLNLLNIANNRITDFSPLAGLNLQSLNTKRNISVDLSMINTSKITNLENDLVCDIQRPSAYERVQSRDYPSLLCSYTKLTGFVLFSGR